MSRIINFSAGPATLPEDVLQQAQAELTDYQGCGMSIMEVSHRGKEYMAVHAEATETLKRLMGLGDDHACLLYTSPSPRDLSTSRMPSSA